MGAGTRSSAVSATRWRCPSTSSATATTCFARPSDTGAGDRRTAAGARRRCTAWTRIWTASRWAGEFEVDIVGDWEYEIHAWVDRFGTWRDELQRKLAAGQTDLAGELSEGRLLLEQVHEHTTEEGDATAAAAIQAALDRLEQRAVGGDQRRAVRDRERGTSLAWG